MTSPHTCSDQRWEIRSIGKVREKMELLLTVGGNVNHYSHLGKKWHEGPSKHIETAIWPNCAISGYIPKLNKVGSSEKHVHVFMHGIPQRDMHMSSCMGYYVSFIYYCLVCFASEVRFHVVKAYLKFLIPLPLLPNFWNAGIALTAKIH